MPNGYVCGRNRGRGARDQNQASIYEISTRASCMHASCSPGRDDEDVGTDRTHPLPCSPGRTWKAVAEHRMHSAVATIALLIIFAARKNRQR